MKGCLSKLEAALAIVIAVSLLVGLVGQIIYILWRRKKLRNHKGAGDELGSSKSSGICGFLLCWRNQSRIEPQEARADVETHRNNESELQELEDMIKWQALYGSSRLLFTIEEGEREGLDSETAYSSCAEKELVKVARTTTTTSKEPDVTMVIVVDDIEMDEGFTTPLETPCASPPYYTPSGSPTRSSTSNVIF